MSLESEQIIAFLKDLDSHLRFKTSVSLYLVGGAAITLFYDQENRTADLDFVDPPQALINKGGKNSTLSKKYRIFISLLPEISFSVPPDWKKRCQLFPHRFKNFKVFVASVEDIVLGKMARLEPKDFEDIFSLHEKNLIYPKKLLQRLQENRKELKDIRYRNNAKLLFKEVFGLSLHFEKGKVSF